MGAKVRNRMVFPMAVKFLVKRSDETGLSYQLYEGRGCGGEGESGGRREEVNERSKLRQRINLYVNLGIKLAWLIWRTRQR